MKKIRWNFQYRYTTYVKQQSSSTCCIIIIIIIIINIYIYIYIYIYINLHISKVANEDCSYDSIQRKPPVVVATGIVPSNTEKNSYDGIIITGSIIHQSVEALLDEEIVHCIILLLLSLCLYVIYQRRGSKHCYYSRCDDTGIINLYHKETTVRHRCTFTYLGYKG